MRDAVLAALNGVLGDHLAATGNPLSTPMALRSQGRALPFQAAALKATLPGAGPRLLVLLHGLCMNDHQWLREGQDHGAALAQAAGYTPVYLHYNSGLPISVNGALFAQQMQALLQAWPLPLQRVVLLGHSMGGLVARSALHQGAQAGQAWVGRVDDAVFLGSPHQGAPLERAGRWLDLMLGAAPYVAPLARLARVRSAGITSLRHGDLLGAAEPGPAAHVPLPQQPRCWAVAGTTGANTQDVKARLLGDGLVPLASALGRHHNPARQLAFDDDRLLIVPRTGHMALLSSREVAAQLLRWLA
jgi:pimeloyl-ACP methyl ester carboxylesterase